MLIISLLGLSWSIRASLHSWLMPILHLQPALWQQIALLGQPLQECFPYLVSKVSLSAISAAFILRLVLRVCALRVHAVRCRTLHRVSNKPSKCADDSTFDLTGSDFLLKQ